MITVPEFRSVGLSRFLVESVIAKCLYEPANLYLVNNFDFYHRYFYEAFGFKVINNDNGFVVNDIHKLTAYLPVQPSLIPSEYLQTILKMAESLQETGVIERVI